MDLQQSIGGVLSTAVASKLLDHQHREQQHVEALLATQKHAMSNLRTLINGLDLVLQLSTPKYSSSHADLLHSLVSRCKSLQKTLETVAARVQRLQAQLQPSDLAETAEEQPEQQATGSPEQQHKQQQQL